MASADSYEKKAVDAKGKTAAKESSSVKNLAEENSAAEKERAGKAQAEDQKEVSGFASPGRNEAPSDGGLSQGMFDGIIDEVKGGGLGAGLGGTTGMAPMGGSGTGGSSGGSGGSMGPDVSKVPPPAPVPQPYPNKGGTGGKKPKKILSSKDSAGAKNVAGEVQIKSHVTEAQGRDQDRPFNR